MRLGWHGTAFTFDNYVDMPVRRRWMYNEALGRLIERSNEQGASRPKDER